jgi:hypothetical protein
MLKKIITLSIVTAVMLIGIENLIAQEQTDAPRQQPRRRQGQEGRPGQKDPARQFRGQQSNSEAPAKGASVDKKIGAMRKKRQQALKQKGTPRDKVGRKSKQLRPWRNQPKRRMFGRRGRDLQGRGYGGWNRCYQCENLCPCCQRSMRGQGRGFQGRGGSGFQGRGMMGRGGPGFQGRGMMGRGGPGFQGRGMMGRGGPNFQGRGMMGRGGPDFQGKGTGGWGQGFRPQGMGRPDPDMSTPPGPPMQRRGMGQSGSDMPSPPGPPMQPRGMGRRGGGSPSGRGPGPGPDNNN